MGLGWVMVFNATFNNISVISWWSVLFVEETELLEDNHRPVESHWQTLSHNVVSGTPRHVRVFEITTVVVIGTDCIGSFKSNYHTITTTTTPICVRMQLLHKLRWYDWLKNTLKTLAMSFKLWQFWPSILDE